MDCVGSVGKLLNALAIGCSECCSRLAAILKSESLSNDESDLTSLIMIWPTVRVPVLSKIMSFACANDSNTCPLVIKKPFERNRLVAAVSAVGVAKDKAQGQVTTNTESAIEKASEESFNHQ